MTPDVTASVGWPASRSGREPFRSTSLTAPTGECGKRSTRRSPGATKRKKFSANRAVIARSTRRASAPAAESRACISKTRTSSLRGRRSRARRAANSSPSTSTAARKRFAARSSCAANASARCLGAPSATRQRYVDTFWDVGVQSARRRVDQHAGAHHHRARSRG